MTGLKMESIMKKNTKFLLVMLVVVLTSKVSGAHCNEELVCTNGRYNTMCQYPTGECFQINSATDNCGNHSKEFYRAMPYRSSFLPC
ncbi:hypothetical protein A3F66_04700 [candidate division TM6 bacterium RIFCSPHIGHO2_12_FULL_32_22]|nr:MAG: hypothetical protein A3F66_04700 [candidate division TM6 bacterium RIFCSPHIGHO2_12_FULL_32_22]